MRAFVQCNRCASLMLDFGKHDENGPQSAVQELHGENDARVRANSEDEEKAKGSCCDVCGEFAPSDVREQEINKGRLSMAQTRKAKAEKKALTKGVKRVKTSKGAKQSAGGEPKKLKPGKARVASQSSKEALSDAQDGKRNNIGPSGQGSHRGQERRNRQAQASGRPNIDSIGGGGTRRATKQHQKRGPAQNKGG